VQVDLVELPRPEIEARLHAGRLQMGALLLSNLEQPAGLQLRVLARSRRQLWVAGDHPLAALGSVPWQALAAQPYILLQVDEGERNALAWWQSTGGQPASFIRTSSMEALREMVALGLGVTILSDMVFRPWSLDGRRIRALPVDSAPAGDGDRPGLVFGHPTQPVRSGAGAVPGSFVRQRCADSGKTLI
jgi:DNA-binding transcriptional LysR family regulator